jgi:hypothetical protein
MKGKFIMAETENDVATGSPVSQEILSTKLSSSTPSDTTAEVRSAGNGMPLKVEYTLDDDKRVSKIEFSNDDQKVTATIRQDDLAYYDYQSDLLDDNEGPVATDVPMSLANVILAAHVALGVIPPMQFDTIACRNKH